MIRRATLFALLMSLLFSVVLIPYGQVKAAETATNAPSPTLIAEVNGPGKGRVWVGAVPYNSSSKPVLVFVHGLHGKAQDWWMDTEYYGRNEMYDLAYNSGYRTAFVSLNDEVDGPAMSMWYNGWTLNRQLDVIMAHYGVTSVNVIAHSKGGVDTNSAIVHYGAAPKVQKLITLSSPHRGSQLADLAYSWWSGWLASLLGQQDDGTYVMQTGYMNYFRSVTDSSSQYSNVRIYTSGGTHWGSFGQAMWFGGSYLWGYDDNDGVVTVSSSHHPRQSGRLFTSSSLNHDNIRKGGDVWWRIEPTARTLWRARTDESVETLVQENAPEATGPMTSPFIFRGGEMKGTIARTSFPVEGGVTNLSFDLLSNNDKLAVTFIAPNGQSFAATAAGADDGFFQGAYHYTTNIKSPASGRWTVELRGVTNQSRTGYMLVANLESPLTLTLAHPEIVTEATRNFNAQVTANSAVRSLRVDGTMAPVQTGSDRVLKNRTQERHSAAAATGANQVTMGLAAPQGNGIYQLGLTVTGTAADGTPFERSFASSFPVVTGELGIEALLPADSGVTNR
ncbi:MAG: hypothetical protein H0T73_20750 [Ardenticatenales bacterium]|nr:hypothetical protein [Ardenticatenales bacterium]